MIKTDAMNLLINLVLITNGIYDLACAAGILWFENLPVFNTLSKLHPTMFADDINSENPVIKRLLSYWLITYGMVRTIAGFHRNNALDIAAAMTYFIEAFCFEYENRVGGTMDPSKVAFVSIVSALMGVWFLMRPYGIFNKKNKLV